MLADFLALVDEHYKTLLLLMLAGACFVLAGGIWWIAIRRLELTIGPDPVIPAVEEPATVPIPRPPKAHLRTDADTHVIAMIPGATPPARIADERLVDGLRQLPCGPDLVEFLDAIDADVRELDAMGPVCGACGGAFGACDCYRGQKSAPEETQVVDLCPLTTQDIEVPADVVLPVHAAAERNAHTQDLTVRLDEILNKERAA